MKREELEILICRYLDGELPAGERAQLEARLAADPETRQALESHRKIDAALRDVAPPAVRWPALAEQVGQQASEQALSEAAAAADDSGVPEELEFRITQFIDGELSDEEAEALKATLATDPAAQKALARQRALDAVLKHGWPMPHVDFGVLAAHLSQRVAEADEAAAEAQRARYRIGAWTGRAARVLAAAACVLIGIGLAVHLARDPGGTTVAQSKPVMQVAVAGPELAAGAATIQISIGPSEQYAGGGMSSPVVVVPSHVQIASVLPNPVDSPMAWPY